MGPGTLRVFRLEERSYLLQTDHQSVQPLLKWNRTHKWYSARYTRWLFQLSYFHVTVQYSSGKNPGITNFLSRNPTNQVKPAEKNEEYLINSVLEFVLERKKKINHKIQNIPSGTIKKPKPYKTS